MGRLTNPGDHRRFVLGRERDTIESLGADLTGLLYISCLRIHLCLVHYQRVDCAQYNIPPAYGVHSLNVIVCHQEAHGEHPRPPSLPPTSALISCQFVLGRIQTGSIVRKYSHLSSVCAEMGTQDRSGIIICCCVRPLRAAWPASLDLLAEAQVLEYCGSKLGRDLRKQCNGSELVMGRPVWYNRCNTNFNERMTIFENKAAVSDKVS